MIVCIFFGVVFVNILLFTGAMYFLVFWRILVDKKKMASWILYLIIPTYQLILLLMYFMNGMEQKLEIEEKLSVLYQQRQYELDYYQMTNHHIEEMRTARHDFKNQIQTAYIMMEQGKSREKIEQLLGQASQWLEQSGMKGYCINPVANALEACEKIVNGRERRIWVKAQCKGNYQIFRVENNYEGMPRIEKGELKTTKNMPQNHGHA